MKQLLLFTLLLISIQVSAQTNKGQSAKKAKEPAFFINFPAANRPSAANTPQVLKEKLGLGASDQLVKQKTERDALGITHEQYNQYYKGIKVEYGLIKAHSRNGNIEVINGEKYDIPEIAVNPALPESAALQKAMAFVGAKRYKWQNLQEEKWLQKEKKDPKATFYPKGELVICRDYLNKPEEDKMVLAYKFDIYAAEPLSRDHIYVNALTGQVIHRNPIIKHADGPADTRYSGTRTIQTELSNATYRLRDPSRSNGVETYNMQRGSTYANAIDFTDTDNTWTAAEYNNANKDNAALDVHWGTQVTYDYWKNVRGRLSFDGNNAKVKSYVHYGTNYDNAFWNGSVFTYGDGGNVNWDAWTSLDIVSHEFAHGVTQYTANLVYQNESGALNESLSDIWGNVVENYAVNTFNLTNDNKNTWLVSEEISLTSPSLRSMINPNAEGDPDTYKGQYWYTGTADNGGVHWNSGVMNHWFYILSAGKTGANDFGESYSVAGIGIEKAAQIVWRMQSVYLGPNSQYVNARTFGIQSAIDLFGANSNEVQQTSEAWKAVGVYSNDIAAPSNLRILSLSTTSIGMQWNDNSSDETGFIIYRSMNNAYGGFQQIATVGAGITSYNDVDLTDGDNYHYRVRAVNTTLDIISAYSNLFSFPLGYPANPANLTATAASDFQINLSWTDNSSNETGFLVERRTSATNTFQQVAEVGAGISTYQDLNLTPGTIYIYRVWAKNRNVLSFSPTNTMQVNLGFPAAPTVLVATAASDTQVNLSWADNSGNETHFVIERSLLQSSGFAEVGRVGANVTTFENAGLETDRNYFYRVKAFREPFSISSSYSNVARVLVAAAPIISMSNSPLTTCSNIFLDPGGLADYTSNLSIVQTFTPESANARLQAEFLEFDLEDRYDFLYIYDGNTVDATRLIGTYTGTSSPGTIKAGTPGGQLTFRFTSDATIVKSGWLARISCLQPVAQAQQLQVNEDTALPITLTGTGEGALTFNVVNAPQHGTLSGTAPDLTYTPEADYFGADSFTFTVSDEDASSEPATVSITITAVNDAPSFTKGPDVTVDEDAGPQTVAAWATDISAGPANESGQTLSFTVSAGQPGLFSAAPAIATDGTLTFTPAANASGSTTVSVKVMDNGGTANGGINQSAEQTFTLTINAVNDAPVAVNNSYNTNEDTQLTVPAPGVLTNDTDIDNDALQASLVSGPSHGSLTLNANGSFSYTPASNYFGPDSFTYWAGDGTATSNTATVSIQVQSINDLPVSVNDSYETDEGTTLNAVAPGVLDNDTDVEGSTLSSILVAGPAHGTLTLNANGSFSYTPTAAYTGPDSFTYKANDGTGNGNTAMVSIAVNPVNDAPVVNSSLSSQSVQYSDAITAVIFTATDADNDPLTIKKEWKKSGAGSFTSGLPGNLILTAGLNDSWSLTGKMQVAPGEYIIRITAHDGTSFPNNSGYTDVLITVTEEDAITTYTGTAFVFTSGTRSTTAQVLLSATLQDISAVNLADAHPGDIKKASLKFRISQITSSGETFVSEIPATSLTYVNASDLRTVIASATWTANIGSADALMYKVQLTVGGYYKENPVNIETITVSKPLPDFVVGGGSVLPKSPAGLISGVGITAGKVNVGLSVKYTKNGSSPKGFVNLFIRRKVNGIAQVFQVKSNAFSSFGVQRTSPAKASVITKANVQEIGSGSPTDWGGNFTVSLTITDNGTPGTNDLVSITIYDKDNRLWYAANWNGSKSAEQNVHTGNFSINSSSSFGPIATAREGSEDKGKLTALRSYPNPFSGTTAIEFSFPQEEQYLLEVYDTKGMLVGRLQEGTARAGEVYQFIWQVDKKMSGVYLLRLTSSRNMQHLKLVVR